jgi:acyl carrier protein
MEQDYVAPRTATEEMLAGVWDQVLSVQKIGIHDNFFALGGHSLLATQVISRLRQTFQVELPVHLLFEEPTISSIADYIEKVQIVQKLQKSASEQSDEREVIEL